MALYNPETKKFTCECGCGREVADPFSTYKPGHYIRTDEINNKISEALVDRILSTETCEAISRGKIQAYKDNPTPWLISAEKRFGMIASDEARKNMSIARRALLEEDPTLGRRISDALSGRILSEEHCRKLSEVRLGSVMDEDTKQRISESMIARWEDPEYRERVLSARTGYTHSEDTLRKMSETRKELWSNPECRRRFLEAIAESRRNRSLVNMTEQMLWEDIREELGSNWLLNVELGRVVAGRIPDFINEKKKRIIELFGEYWHDPIASFNTDARTEEETIETYREEGWDCIVVWECDVKLGFSFLGLGRFR